MDALERHDAEIKKTTNRIQRAVEKNMWNVVNDLNKYLTTLLKDRKEYVRNRKLNNL